MRRLLTALLTSTFLAAPAAGQEIDAQATIAGLAQPQNSEIAFTEVRFSVLLSEPLVVVGVLRYAGTGALDREIEQPYRETTRIREDSVTVSREGERERSFALRRAPELQALLHAFTALLAGDYAGLEDYFSIAASGVTEAWQLTLTPLDKRLRERIREFRIDGHGAQARCFWLLGDDAGVSVMVLGDLARSMLATAPTRTELQEHCAA